MKDPQPPMVWSAGIAGTLLAAIKRYADTEEEVDTTTWLSMEMITDRLRKVVNGESLLVRFMPPEVGAEEWASVLQEGLLLRSEVPVEQESVTMNPFEAIELDED